MGARGPAVRREAAAAVEAFLARRARGASNDERWRVSTLRARVLDWLERRPEAFWSDGAPSAPELVEMASREDPTSGALLEDLGGRPKAALGPTERESAAPLERARADLLALRRFDPERIDAAFALYDAVADAWAARRGLTRDAWYRTHIAGVAVARSHTVVELPLPQGETVKAATAFLRGGLAIVFAFETADVSSLAHEAAHLFRRDLEGEDLRLVEEWLGVEGGAWVDGAWRQGRWTDEAEELFARAFERYLLEGVPPRPELEDVFATLRRTLRRIYLAVAGSPVDVRLTGAARRVFDKVLGSERERQAVVAPVAPGANPPRQSAADRAVRERSCSVCGRDERECGCGRVRPGASLAL